MARRPGPPRLSAVFCLLFLALAATAGASEIAGRVVLPRVAAQASLGLPGLDPGVEGPPKMVAATDPVIVYVAQAAGDLPPTETANARVRIARGIATPALVPVSLGSQITFENADGRKHHLVCRRGALRRDLGVLAPGAEQAATFDEPGNLRFICADHKDVAVEVVVFAHAAFAVVDAQGNYRLPDLPPGLATIVAYSPRLGEVSREVEVTASGSSAVDFTF
jgi:plastocyanin